MGVKIIVDSTADLTPWVRQRVDVVPLTIHFGQKEYVDGVTIDSKTFYEMLVESDVLPTTSQATPFAFEEAFRKAVEDGFEVVCDVWNGYAIDYYRKACGVIFFSKEEAATALTVKYRELTGKEFQRE